MNGPAVADASSPVKNAVYTPSKPRFGADGELEMRGHFSSYPADAKDVELEDEKEEDAVLDESPRRNDLGVYSDEEDPGSPVHQEITYF